MKPNKLMIFMSLILILSFGAHALSNTGQGSSPFFNADYDNTFDRSVVSITGQDKQPLACDLDSGTEKEFITYEGNTLFVYKLGASGLELAASYNTGKPIYGIECVVSTTDPEFTDRNIFTIHDDTVVGYGLSFGAIQPANTFYTFPSTIAQASDPFCVERFGTNVDFYCAFGDGSQIYFVPSGTVIGESAFNFSESNSVSKNVILDIENDLTYSVSGTDIRVCDILNTRLNGSAPSCSVLKSSPRSGGEAKQLIGYDSIVGTTVCHMYEDGASFLDRIDMSCHFANSQLFSVADDGPSTTVYSVAYEMFMYDLDLDGNIDVCFNYRINNNVETTKCYDLSGNEIVGVSQGANKYLRGIGNVKEIDNPYFVYYDFANSDVDFIDVDNSSNTDTIAFNDDKLFLLERIDSDAQQEILGESSTGIVMYNAPSSQVDTIVVNSSNPYSGIFGFFDPTCTLTNFEFIARECVEGLTECTYYNLNSEPFIREKLCTDCAGTSAYHCGDWSYTEPKVNCTFTTAGTKSIDIDLFTDTNEAFVAYEFDTFEMGVQTSECDLPDDKVDVPDIENGTGVPPDTGEIPEGIPADDIFSALLTNIFLIIAFGMIMGVPTFLYFTGVKSPFIMFVAAFLMTILSAMLGMINFLVSVYIIVGMLIIAVFVGVFFKYRGA